MGASLSAFTHAAYGEKLPHADIGRGMDILDAAHLIAHHSPGGVKVLAARMGVSENTLQHKLNPNNTSHHLNLREAVLLQQVSGFPFVLNAMATALGFVPIPARPDAAEGDALEAFFFLQQAHGDLTAAAADALRTGKAISTNELRRLEFQANEAIAGITSLLNAVAARVPKREEG